PLRGGEQPSGHIGPRAYRQSVTASDVFLEIGGRQTGPKVDIDPARAQDFGGARAQGIGDQHLWHQAALAAWRSSSQAQSSQGSSNATSAGSTVAPVQIRIPGGEARWLAMSYAAPSSSSRFAIARAVRKRPSHSLPANPRSP